MSTKEVKAHNHTTASAANSGPHTHVGRSTTHRKGKVRLLLPACSLTTKGNVAADAGPRTVERVGCAGGRSCCCCGARVILHRVCPSKAGQLGME